MSDKTIDLDALAPEPVTVKIGSELIKINPPSTLVVFKLGRVGQRMQGDLSDTEITEVVADLTALVGECVPGIDAKTLNTAQLFKLMEIISEMGTPKEVKELTARGITPSGPKAE